MKDSFHFQPVCANINGTMRYLRKITGRLAATCMLVMLAGSALGATYYIDFTTGSDSNSGQSTTSPWKRHPFMVGWAGSYSHAVGDRFIFKGGVTWDKSCLPIQFGVGGTANNHDYYGVSSTWYAGSAWSRPIFDAQSAVGAIFWMHQGASGVTIDGFDLRGVQAGNNFGQSSISIEGCINLTVTNCWIHKWTHAASVTTDGQFGGFFNTPMGQHAGLTNVIITHCDIGNDDGDRNSGTCLYYPGEVAFCKIHDSPEGILHGGYSVHDNEFYNIVASYDPAQHPNVAYLDAWNGYYSVNGPCLFYNNYIHGDVGSAEVIYPNGSVSAPGYADFYIYNNVVIAENYKTIDIDAWGGANMRLYIFNNTFVNNSGTHIRVVPRTQVPDTISYYNNHFVGGTVYYAAGTLHTYSGNNLVHTLAEASAAGYTLANFYAPSLSTAPSVGTATNFTGLGLPAFTWDTSRGGYRTPITRPATAAWDIGAYAFTGAGIVTGNVAPIVSPITQNAADVDPNVAGFQIYEGTVVQYSGSASDPNGDALTWQWIYTVDGGSEVVFQSGAGPVPAISFSYRTGMGGSTYVWKLRVSDGTATTESLLTVGVQAPPVAGQGLTLEAELGVISAPFVATNGYIVQSTQTGVTNGGRATFSITITNAGSYVIQALVNAPGDGANSFYLNIDTEPQDPSMIWQIPITSGFENRIVNWQGSGTFDNPQFVPKVFNLTGGLHQVIIRGREANTQLDRFSLLRVPQPPQNLRIPPAP
jgi:hypothetical protein